MMDDFKVPHLPIHCAKGETIGIGFRVHVGGDAFVKLTIEGADTYEAPHAVPTNAPGCNTVTLLLSARDARAFGSWLEQCAKDLDARAARDRETSPEARYWNERAMGQCSAGHVAPLRHGTCPVMVDDRASELDAHPCGLPLYQSEAQHRAMVDFVRDFAARK